MPRDPFIREKLAQSAVGEHRIRDDAAARADQRWQMNSPQGWSKLFQDPVTLPNGRKLVTLLDAGTYIADLPRKEIQSDHWQAAIEALLIAVDGHGPLLHARVGMLRALNRHAERTFNPSRKDPH